METLELFLCSDIKKIIKELKVHMCTLVSNFLFRNTSRHCVFKTVFLAFFSCSKKQLDFANTNRKIMYLSSVINVFEKHVPKHLAEKWDNTGLLIEPDKQLSVSPPFIKISF